MRNRLIAATSVTSVLLAMGAVLSPVQAGDVAYPGTGGELNVWENDGYDGCRISHGASSANITTCNEELGFRLSSFVNKTGKWWIMYTGYDYNGSRLCVRPRSHDDNIGNDTAYEDDIRSVEIRGDSQPVGCADVTGSPN